MSHIQTFTGRRVQPLNLHADDFCIEDIAHALSLKCRYTGHSRRFYSVAEHSVHVSDMVPPEHALAGLLHDASEAYLPDIAGPIKNNFFVRNDDGSGTTLSDFGFIEEQILRKVFHKYGAVWPIPKTVHTADKQMLPTEKRELFDNKWAWDADTYKAYDFTIPCLSPRKAEAAFLSQFYLLTAQKGSHVRPDPNQLAVQH